MLPRSPVIRMVDVLLSWNVNSTSIKRCRQKRDMMLAGDGDQFGVWQVSALVMLWASGLCMTCLVPSRLYPTYRCPPMT